MSVHYYSHKRRMIMRQGDDIDHLTLFEMWGWKCHLCGEKIDSLIRFPNKMAATIDHIIPLSRGGEHVWENCRPSHSKCNEAKADKLDAGQEPPISGMMAPRRTTSPFIFVRRVLHEQ